MIKKGAVQLLFCYKPEWLSLAQAPCCSHCNKHPLCALITLCRFGAALSHKPTYMRTLIGSTLTLALAFAFGVSANAQVSVQTKVSATIQTGKASTSANVSANASTSQRDSARINGAIQSQLNAATSARERANENSALNATVTSTTSVASKGEIRKVPARFLGFIPANITAKVEVDVNGKAKLRFPWWGFLFRVKSDASAAVDAK